MPNIGTSVGGYQLLDLLHTGRNSQIFQATREGGGQQVALKFLLPERRKDRKAVKTHVQEFQMAKSLEHPLLVRMLQYERNRNKKSADFGRTDIYALGCTIYEMLTGKPPIRAENPDELLLKHCRSTPLTLTQLGMEDVTPEMDALALTMLAKKKEERRHD